MRLMRCYVFIAMRHPKSRKSKIYFASAPSDSGGSLASIAAVSKLQLKTSDGESGIELELEGGNIVSKKPGPLRKGTEITVSQLFFNTPARLKYLKTIQTELGHSIDLMNRLALGYPNIAFKLVIMEEHSFKRMVGEMCNKYLQRFTECKMQKR